MNHPKQQEVRALREDGLSYRAIEKRTGVSRGTIGRILKGQSSRNGFFIEAKIQRWKVTLNPWIMLIYEAAKAQIPECRSLNLSDFIYYCCNYVKRFFKLHPPGWEMETAPVLDLTDDPSWNSPQVRAAVRKLELEKEAAMQGNFRGHV